MTTNKKILIVTECFYPEEFKVNDIALSWRDKGYDIDVLTLAPTYPLGEIFPGYKNKLFQKDEYKGIVIYRVHAVTGYKSNAFKKILKYLNFMVLGSIVAMIFGRRYNYVFGFNTGALTGMLPAVIIRKLFNKPLTLWAQDIWPESVYAYGFKKTKLLAFVLDVFVKFIHHNIDGIAISGKGFKEKLRPYARKGLTFYYLPNWADDLDMTLAPAKLSDEPKVQLTFAGNIGKVQNLENIIKAYNELDDEYLAKSQLNIIGDGSALEKMKEINRKPSVVFYGKRPRSEMSIYYQASDFLIVSLINKPIFNTTVPAKLQTYIAAKRPILAIILGDTAKIVCENNLGLTAHPGCIESIKVVLTRAISMEKSELKQFTDRCDKLNKEVFDKNMIIDSLLALTITGSVE